MSDVFRVANYILEKSDAIPAVKLQKLAYYCQAYHLATYGEVLFHNKIEAWSNGPTIVDLSDACRGKFIVSRDDLPSSTSSLSLSDEQIASIDYVLDKLGSWTSNKLGEQINKEAPWLDQRAGLSLGQRCDQAIDPDTMRLYYSSPHCDNPLFA